MCILQIEILEGMLMHQRELFAEESLKGIFSHLVSFVIQVVEVHACGMCIYVMMVVMC
jgi:hypothetical protein